MSDEVSIFVGTIDVVLEHEKLKKLSLAEAKSVAINFAAVFEVEINIWANENHFPFHTSLEVQEVWNGCVKAKLKVFLAIVKNGATVVAVAGGALYGAVVKYPDYRDVLHAIAKRTAAKHGCKLGNESFVCYGSVHTIRLTEEIYVTREGETFGDVCEHVWKIPQSMRKRYLMVVLDTQRDVFLDIKSQRLVGGKILFRPTESQLKQIPGK